MSEYLSLSVNWLPVAQKNGFRLFAHAHGYDVSPGYLKDPKIQAAYRRLNDAEGIVTMSEASRKDLVNIGIQNEKIHVIPYGVDVPAENTSRDRTDPVRCLAVGRMVAKKAPVLLLKAFHKALKTYPLMQLDYVGDGDLLPLARKYVDENGLAERVKFYGARPNDFVLERMKKSHIFLQHSIVDPQTGDQEGLPVAILEAMAHGLAVVSTVHAGIPEAVVDGSTGYLVAEGDVDGMAECIARIAKDPTLLGRFSVSAWLRAKEHFTYEKSRYALQKLLGLQQYMSR